jgi:hypothetical protein
LQLGQCVQLRGALPRRTFEGVRAAEPNEFCVSLRHREQTRALSRLTNRVHVASPAFAANRADSQQLTAARKQSAGLRIENHNIVDGM